MIPHRTVWRDRSQRAVLKCKRRSMTFGVALLLLAALALINLSGAEAADKMADIPSSEEATVDGEQLMPQALSLTTLLSEDPTAEALQPGHTDASLQPLSEHNASPDAPGADGRRRRRLGRKRKRRPLQDDYWPPAAPEDNDTESNGFAPTAASGRVSDRKRLPYAGAAASRWEEPVQRAALARPAMRSNANHHQRPGDWMHNPYTDAINVEQPPATVRRLPGGQSASSAPAPGNLSPIDPNRSRRIAGGRPTEQPPTNGKAYRKPYSQARRTEEPSSPGDAGGSGETGKVPVSATDLKALLKQSDGLSLSEILQQRNISLQDLIKGKQMALAALTQSPLDATTTMTTMGDESSTTLSPTLSSVRFRVHSDDSVAGWTEASGDTSTATTPTTSTVIPANDLLTTSGFNGHLPSAVEDESNNAVGDDIGHGVGNIFPTVEIKQLALNPVLPMHKDEQRIRPIKGVASRIRPDLSNTHIRTEPGQVAPRVRLPVATTTTGSPTVGPTNPSLLLMTSTTRERWTPSAALAGQRQKFQTTGKQFHPGRYGFGTTLPSGFSSTASEGDNSPLALTTTPVGTTTEPPSAKKLIGFKLSSAEATSILPEAEAMVELSPERQLHQHLLRVPKLKPRIAIKPKLTNVVPPTLPAEAPSTTVPPSSPPSRATEKDRFNLSDVELGEDSTGEGSATTPSSKQGRQQRLNDDLDDSEEPGLNIIEKFTSFADSAIPATQEERDSEQAAVADLIGRISEHTQRSFTDSLEDLYRDVTESNPSLFNDLSPIASADDRRELLELMEDRRIGSRLAKVLSQRNMTLEQLLEHRRRGSSQLHLAEIANGKVKPIDDKIDIVTAFEHFPRFNIGNLRSIRPDDIKLDSQGFSYFTSIINIRPSDEAYKEARALQDRHRSRRPGATPGNHRGDAHFLVKGGSKDRLLVPSRMSAGMEHAYGSNSENYDHQEDHRNDVGDLLDLELSGHGFQHHRSASVTIESTSMPVGVRSAIVASAAIVGVSLVIFIAIFVACRLRQRRRQKLNYTENFNMAKGRLPILHGSDQETVRKSCTPSVSGRSSSLGEQVVYTTHRALAGTSGSTAGTATTTTASRQRAMMDPNSVEVQDYLWDRKPFQ
ncbi:uncharacterized protein LOC128310270 [Anopheles moucheti]|uniref:uncharacterized protein LOC128310270 n=1 Tax=Anopheles moucheti TaxID=186751 RepID=UPI0022F116A7|nr:uncharacterized protein LOC128310270 [Anopheles moucheti]